jgi:hypothetical protein
MLICKIEFQPQVVLYFVQQKSGFRTDVCQQAPGQLVVSYCQNASSSSMSTSPKQSISGSLVNSSVVGSNLTFGSVVNTSIAAEASSPKGAKRPREAAKTTLPDGTLVENSFIDGVHYKSAMSVGGYLVEMEAVDVDTEPKQDRPRVEAKAEEEEEELPDVLGLPNGVRVQESTICGKFYQDAILKDGRFVEIAALPDEESRAAATAEPVCIRASAIDAGNVFHGTWNRGRLIDRTSVFGKGNRIHASMTACYVAGDKNVFAFSNVEVTVLGSSNEIHTPMRSCRIRGLSNILNAGFVKSHIRGDNNKFRKGLENSTVAGSQNSFSGKAINCNITGDRNEFGGDVIGCTIESSDTRIG